MLSARKVAERLGCAQDYVSKLCREGKLVGRQVDGAWFIEQESISVFEKMRDVAKVARAEALADQRRRENKEYKIQHAGEIKKQFFARAIGAARTGLFFAAGSALLLGSVVFAGENGKAHGVQTAPVQLGQGGVPVAQHSALFFGTPTTSVALSAAVEETAAAAVGNFFSRVISYFFAAPAAHYVVAPENPTAYVPQQVTETQSSAPGPDAPVAPTKTVVVQQNTYPVIQRTLERVVSVGGISETELTDRLNQLNNKLQSQISTIANPGYGSPRGNFDFSQAVNNLSNVTVHGVSGLTDADIPDTISLSGVTIGGATISSFTGTGLSVVNGVLTASGGSGFSTTSADYYVNASSTIPKTYSDNVFTGGNIFGNSTTTNATTTNLYIAGSVRGGGLTTSCIGSGDKIVWDATTGQFGCGTDAGGSGSGISGLKAQYGTAQTGATQTLATSTAGTDFTITSAGDIHTFNLPSASASNRGLLTAADFTTFNSKQSALSFAYPLLNSAGTISLAFSTTTANTWSALQTFTSGFLAAASSTVNNTLAVTGATTLGSTLNVLGQTTLATSLSGLLKATAGVVSTATAGVDYLTSANVFSYLFPGNATSTQLTFNGGFLSTASSTINSTFHIGGLSDGALAVFGGLVSSGATTTAGTGLTYSGNAFNVNSIQSISKLSNLASAGFVKTSSDGTLSVDTATYLTSALTSIGPAGQTTTGAAVTLASSTTGTDFTITGSGSTLTFNLPTASASNRGLLSSTDWNTFNNKGNVGYPFALSGNATSTLTQFNAGLTAFASSTIGSGTQSGGLTIFGGATTTANAYFASAVTAATTFTLPTLGTAAGAFLAVDANGQIISTTTPSGGGGGSGTVTNIATTYPLLGGPITNTGTLSLAFGTTTANIWGSLQTFSAGFLAAASSTVNGTFVVTGQTTLASSLNGPLQANQGVVSATSSVGTLYGGTGITSYTTGDILYADATNHLAKLGIGSTGSVLKVAGGLPGWGLDATGGGSGGGSWSTTTSQVPGELINYSNNSTDIVTIGNNATTSAAFWFDPTALVGYISNKLGIGTSSPSQALSIQGNSYVSGTSFFGGAVTATSTLSVTGLSTLGSLNVTGATTLATSLTGLLKASSGVVSTAAYTDFPTIAAGTLLANATGGTAAPTAVATSSLFGTGSGGQVLTWNAGVPQWVATTTYSAPLVFSNGNVSCTAASAGVAGCLSGTDWSTFNNKQATIAAAWPITLTGATVGFNGLSTSTAAVVGNIPYYSGLNTFANVATSAPAIGSVLTYSGTLGSLVGGVGGTFGIANTSITNAMLAGSIAYSKLALTGAILNADLAGSIAYSKLSLTGAILNADLAGSIAASKLVGTDITTVGTVTSGTWSGSFGTVSGANLTNLTAANVTGSHTLPDGVLSTNVPLLDAANAFSNTGNNTFVGNVGVGSSTPTSRLSIQGNQYTSGTAFFGGAVTATSTLTVQGQTTLATSLTGLLKASSGVVSTAALTDFPAIAANTVLANNTSGSAAPTAVATSSLFQNASATLSGLLTSTDWSTFNNKSGFAYPFTTNSGYVSTTSVVGFLTGGIFSNASSTFSGTFHLPSLSDGALAVFGGLVSSGATTTAGTGLTYTGNAFNVNSIQSISKLSNLASAGFVKTSSDGTLSVDTSTYLTSAVTSVSGTWPIISSGGNTPALSFGGLSTSTAAVVGNIPYYSGVNTFANVATSAPAIGSVLTYSGTLGSLVGGVGGTFGIANSAVTNAMLAGSIAYSKLSLTGAIVNADLAGSIAASKLVGSDIATVGTIGTGVWQGTKIGLAYGGTNADLSATGGASQVLRQSSSGGAITVSQLAASDLSNGTTGSGAVALAGSPTFTGTAIFANASTTQIGSTGNAYFATSAGSVGIGTTTPTSALSVQGNSYHSGTAFFGGAITATSTLTLSPLGTAAGTFIAVNASGQIIATTTPSTSGVTSVTGTWPVISSGGTTPAISFGGLSTSTAAVVGNIPYFSGVNTFANVATTAPAIGSVLTYSGTLGSLVGGVGGTFGIANTSITNAMLAGSIAASKLVGTDITTVGTITSGTWSGSFGAVSGANLTNLTAANITGSHTLSDNVLSTNVPLLNAANTFSSSGITSFGGSVGIVTTNPLAKLEVVGSSQAATDRSTHFELSTGTGLLTDEKLVFGVHDGDYSWIQAVKNGTGYRYLNLNPGGGNVGVGTTTPDQAFSVNGSMSVSSAAQGYLKFTSTSGINYIQSATKGTSGNGAPLYFTDMNASNTWMTIGSTGNVGVGTTTPWRTLSVNGNSDLGTSALAGFFTATSTTASTFAGNVGIGSTSPSRAMSIQSAVSTAQMTVAYDTSRYTDFLTNSTGDLTITPQGQDATLYDSNLWVCSGVACPTGTPTGTGNIIAETNIGIGTTTPKYRLTIESQSTSEDLFQIATSSNQKVFIVDRNGSVGIGTTTPTRQFSISDRLFVGAGGVSGMGTATSTFMGDIKITGKLDVGTIDPVYTIDGLKYATYGHSTVGIKEEAVEVLEVTNKNAKTGKYETKISFKDLDKGSDLWLFYQVTDFGTNWKNLVINLTASFDGSVFYTKVPNEAAVIISTSQPGEVSARFIANRYDSAKWPNVRPDQGGSYKGHELETTTTGQAAPARGIEPISSTAAALDSASL
ncbi:MAG: helix-turn-helix domain-containing protein [Candidatus Adlerbacteria bacterium]|nr:helix-turn-helix domain-containing protein [Candidatus Adlerbacteria bacterium]